MYCENNKDLGTGATFTQFFASVGTTNKRTFKINLWNFSINPEVSHLMIKHLN